MLGVYTARINLTALAAAKTMLHVLAPAGYYLQLIAAGMTNRSVTVQEQYDVGVSRSTAGSPAGTAVASETTIDGDPLTDGATVLGGLTAEPTYDAAPLDEQGCNNLIGYYWEPPPAGRPLAAPGHGFGLRLLAAPTNSFNATAILTYRLIPSSGFSQLAALGQ